MAEEIHEPDSGAEGGSQPDRWKAGILRRLLRILLGVMSLSAAARSFLATRPEERPAATVPEEQVAHPDREEIRYPDGRIEHPHVCFERTDASLGWILGIGIGSLALAAITFSALLWFFHHYNNYQAAIKRSPFPLAQAPSVSLPATPHLEQLDRIAGIERSNIYQRQAGKEGPLHSYGPTLGNLMELTPSTVGLAATAGGPLTAIVALDAGTRIPEHGFIRIPIRRAMDLLANKLPARQEPPVSQRRKANGLVDAGESNSGRMFREEPRWYER
jgi:hypothetical protein